jgi:hypothetical protein
MTSRSIIDEQFSNGFNEANACYKSDKLLECIDLCYKLLNEPDIPRHHKMKTLVLLGATVGDWDEANDCFVAAQSLWKIERRWHPEGKNETLDKFMVEIREALDGLSQALAEEQPSHFGVGDGGLYIVDEEDTMLEDEDAVLDIINEEDERIEDASAMLEDGDAALDIVDEEDGRAADARAMLVAEDAALDIVDKENGRVADARVMLEDLDIDEDTPSLQDSDREPVSDINLDLYSSKSKR